jgi:ribosomal protein S11
MTNSFKINLNKLLKSIFIKKQQLQNLKKQSLLLNNVIQENYKLINKKFFKITNNNLSFNNNITYIIDITFSKSNTFLHVTDALGKLNFFCSAGHLQYKGKTKKIRYNVLKSFYHVLITKLKFLKNKSVALHLKNVGFNKFFIIKLLKKKFYIKIIKIFNIFPFNGCRKKKVVRKKNKKNK